jgi:hypothetical protein
MTNGAVAARRHPAVPSVGAAPTTVAGRHPGAQALGAHTGAAARARRSRVGGLPDQVGPVLVPGKHPRNPLGGCPTGTTSPTCELHKMQDVGGHPGKPLEPDLAHRRHRPRHRLRPRRHRHRNRRRTRLAPRARHRVRPRQRHAHRSRLRHRCAAGPALGRTKHKLSRGARAGGRGKTTAPASSFDSPARLLPAPTAMPAATSRDRANHWRGIANPAPALQLLRLLLVPTIVSWGKPTRAGPRARPLFLSARHLAADAPHGVQPSIACTAVAT